jgi:4-alpha-glucanotransferase
MADLQSLPETPPAEGSPHPGRRLALPEPLPLGYHQLTVELGGRTAESLVISAPSRCFTGGKAGDGKPLWGVFLPLYALRTSRSWGAGDFSDLETLAEWTAGLGGGVVGTQPLLATFLDEPFEPSPYAPASRLFWNELYIDPRRLPEMEDCPAARRLIESPDFQREVEALRAAPRVDYARLMALKRRVLEELAQRFFSRPGDRLAEFESFVADKPGLENYAAFRAVGDRRGESWQSWPGRLREGTLAPADYDEEDRRYYLWTQWAADQQLSSLAKEARRHAQELDGSPLVLGRVMSAEAVPDDPVALAELLTERYLEAGDTLQDDQALHQVQAMAGSAIARLAWLRNDLPELQRGAE